MRAGARAELRAADRRVLLPLRLARDARGRRDGLRRPLRGRRRHRPGGAVRRPHQELALPRLALHLDRRPAAGDRGGVAAAAPSSTAAAASRCSAPRCRCSLRRWSAAETGAIREAFLPKRRIMLARTARGGRALRPRARRHVLLLGRHLRPAGAINDGMSFFRAALERQVICVPGEFFDVNPGKRRSGRPSRFRHYVRFSFGPDEATVVEGVQADSGRWCRSIASGLVRIGILRSPSARSAPSGPRRSAGARSRTGRPRCRSRRS